MFSDSSDSPLFRDELPLETYRQTISPFFTPFIRNGAATPTPLASSFLLSAQPNTLGLVTEDDGVDVPGIPIFSDSFFQHQAPQIADYEYTTGWVQKPSGEYEYVEPGMIEQADDATDSDYGFHVDDSGYMHDELGASKPLPKDAPPPPQPDLRSRKLELLPEEFPSHAKYMPQFVAALEGLSSFTTSTEHEEQDTTFIGREDYSPIFPVEITKNSSPLRQSFTNVTVSTPKQSAASGSGSLSDWQILLSQNLDMLQCASDEVLAFQKVLQEQGDHFDLSVCINLCQRVKEALVFAADGVRAMSLSISIVWGDKSLELLMSLQRTTTRLRSLVQWLNPPRLDDRFKASISKLEEHELKLLNLAAKFKSAMKRQRVRHAHGHVAQAHADCRSLRSGRPSVGGMDKRIQRRNSFIRRPSMSGQGL